MTKTLGNYKDVYKLKGGLNTLDGDYLKFLEYKWSLASNSKKSIFTGKRDMDGFITIPIAESGLCLLNAFALSVKDQHGEIDQSSPVVVMIDTGATDCFISTNATNRLRLIQYPANVELRAFETSLESSFVWLLLTVPGLYEEAPIKCFLNENINGKEFDIIIGAEFLDHFIYSRDPHLGTFSLKLF